ncbi:unnamed protein product [Clavelina lepadiformis]|uniref:Matrix-remodeling-associated protein 7 helical domain-containing protein n=1 Tax=Clavelina lepadiformis TaxID=159417 RepID=A0ABP0FLQ2_CLALP
MMSLNWVYDYVYLLGGLNTFLLAVLVILVTRYTFYSASKKKQVSKVKVKAPLPEKQPRKNFAAGDQATPFGCSAEHLNEVMRCAWILHNYEPPNTEFGSGEPSVKVGKNTEEYQKNVPILGKGEPLCIPLETKGVHVKDSPLTGVLEEEDQEVDLLDLLPENIELANDEELDEDTAMSPQAMADIEAEMLDLSILNETLDEQHDTVAEGYEDQEISLLKSSSIDTASLTQLSQASKTLTEEQLENEKRVQQHQLDQILAVMKQNPEIFGEMTSSDMQDQAKLYSI